MKLEQLDPWQEPKRKLDIDLLKVQCRHLENVLHRVVDCISTEENDAFTGIIALLDILILENQTND